ncbi:MAG: sulfatase-like hydrolase/transferase [Halobacteriaceae archaeon]
MTRNVVLLCLDSVREDYFREHGTRLRERADVVYTQCRAVSGWSVPSHASMFTGQLPHEHGIHVYNRDFSGLDRADTFLGDLPDHHAVGVSANAYATSTFGFDGIFDAYTDVSPHRRFPDGIDVMQFGQTHDKAGLAKHVEFVRRALAHDHPLQSLANGAFRQVDEWLERAPVPKLFDDGASIVCRQLRRSVAEAPEPFFAFANLMDAHGPHHHVWGYDRSLHDAPNTWSSGDYGSHEVNTAEDRGPYETDLRRTREVYGASVDYLDRVVDGLVDDVLAATEGETTVVVTADHGENLGLDADRGFVAHKGSLTEGLLHVPLAVINASESPPGAWLADDTERNRMDHATGGMVTDYVSHLALPDLLVGLATGDLPDVRTETPLAERVGSNLPGGVDRESAEGRYWDRAIRVVYETYRKRQYNSLGDAQSYAIGDDRPNWQSPVDEDFDADALDREHFSVPIAEYDRQAREAATEVSVDEATARRLADLGYR